MFADYGCVRASKNAVDQVWRFNLRWIVDNDYDDGNTCKTAYSIFELWYMFKLNSWYLKVTTVGFTLYNVNCYTYQWINESYISSGSISLQLHLAFDEIHQPDIFLSHFRQSVTTLTPL